MSFLLWRLPGRAPLRPALGDPVVAEGLDQKIFLRPTSTFKKKNTFRNGDLTTSLGSSNAQPLLQ